MHSFFTVDQITGTLDVLTNNFCTVRYNCCVFCILRNYIPWKSV